VLRKGGYHGYQIGQTDDKYLIGAINKRFGMASEVRQQALSKATIKSLTLNPNKRIPVF
jgi:hypothetical protein